MTSSGTDQERVELNQERQKFAEASARLAIEKAGFEAERVAWIEEKLHAKRTISLTRTPVMDRRLGQGVPQSQAALSRPERSVSAGRESDGIGMKSGPRRQSRSGPEFESKTVVENGTTATSIQETASESFPEDSGDISPPQTRPRINRPSVGPRPKFTMTRNQ